MPDLAEVGFLLHLKNIIEGIERIYPPGARFRILTEGDFYLKHGPLFDVTSEQVSNYEEVIRLMSDRLLGDKVTFDSLATFSSQVSNFPDIVSDIEASLSSSQYQPLVETMAKSLTSHQIRQGVYPVTIARRYAALQEAKRFKPDGKKGLIDSYLEQELGEDYIYCSLTISDRDDSLTIDPRPMYRAPFLLPQHGIGVLIGGERLDVMEFNQLLEVSTTRRVRGIFVDGFGELPFGYAIEGNKKG